MRSQLQKINLNKLIIFYAVCMFILAWIPCQWFSTTSICSALLRLFPGIRGISQYSINSNNWEGYFCLAAIFLFALIPVMWIYIYRNVNVMTRKTALIILLMPVLSFLVLYMMTQAYPAHARNPFDSHPQYWRKGLLDAALRFMLSSKLGLATIGSFILAGASLFVALLLAALASVLKAIQN